MNHQINGENKNRRSSSGLKKIILYTLSLFLALIIFFAFQNYPFSSPAKNFPALSDIANIRRNLESIINTRSFRNYQNTDVLDTVANRIKKEFIRYTDRVYFQDYTFKGHGYKNVIASFGPEGGQRIIVGAHYDVCGEQDGADDNASGVAGVLELARLLNGQSLKYRVDLVAYSLEEPPYFNTKQMGSYVHAQSLHDSDIPVKGMVSLEMIGYYSDAENSQEYPVGILKSVYGSKGNFITIVQKSVCGDFAKQFKKVLFENNSIITKCFRCPSFVAGVNLSDHANYWKFGYSAVMITNTAFFRNHNYHKKSDTPATLDLNKTGLAVDGVFRTLLHLN